MGCGGAPPKCSGSSWWFTAGTAARVWSSTRCTRNERCSAYVIAASATSPSAESAIRTAIRRARSDTGSGPRQPQRVAHAADRVDQRVAAHVDLLAQVADVGLEHAG